MKARRSFFDVYVSRATLPLTPEARENVARATRALRAIGANTQRGRVLLALVTECSLRGVSEVSEVAVAVRAWRLFPAEFSLPGFPEYPDARQVCARLSSGERIVAEGYAERPAVGVVRVTPKAWGWWEAEGGSFAL